ncbi:Sodium/calcium exchanger protein-domain-containing protein [Chlamydoabsidia padenii]|nr:Sodium/calcium exchanger protein-domain-containing protein [Chlamydoabsidia padenii]
MINRKLFYGLCIGFIVLWYTFASSSEPTMDLELLGTSPHKKCSHIERHKDECAFVKSACSGFSGMYLRFYYCSQLWRPLSVTLMVSGLLLLFGAVSVVASDFFCPNLQTISTKLQLSESMAGVTILAFGNGSPDLFSTFSAMNSGSGSLAIGELIGAAFFIVSVVSGSMGIIRPFKSKQITFMRDASYLTGAIIMITWIVYHQRICWYHGVALITYYVSYVFIVVFGTYYFPESETPAQLLEPKALNISVNEQLVNEASRLLGNQDINGKPLRLSIPEHGFLPQSSSSSQHFGHVIRPVSINSSQQSLRSSLRLDSIYGPRTASTNGSISSRLYRHHLAPRVGIRTSLFSAIEFQEQVTSIRRANSTQLMHTQRQRDPSLQTPTWRRSPEYSAPNIQFVRRPDDGWATQRSTHLDDRPPQITSQQRISDGDGGNNINNSNSNNTRDDYFAYISANQHQTKSIDERPQPTTSHSTASVPQIRLAPPTAIQHCQQQKPQQQLIPTPDQVNSLGIGTAHVLHTTADVDTGEDHDQQSISVALPTPDPTKPLHPAPDFLLNETKPSVVMVGPIPVPLQTYLVLEDILLTLCPTLQDWSNKTTFSKLSSLVALPLVLVFTLTLPVVESEDIKIDDFEVAATEDQLLPSVYQQPHYQQPVQQQQYQYSRDPIESNPSSTNYLGVPQNIPTATRSTSSKNTTNGYLAVPEAITPTSSPSTPDHHHRSSESSAVDSCSIGLPDDTDYFMDSQPEWCQWLVIVQAVCACTFSFTVMSVNGFIDLQYVSIGTGLGCILALTIMFYTDAKEQPSWYWLLSFAGFVIALNWIFLLANEMVGLLQALGAIFDISEAIMGLTIFALGSSVGDLVANTAIAKMGFPTMAISACYAGPLLNMVLGVGISSTYQTLLTGVPYKLDIAPTILLSSAGLITVLLSTLVVVNLNGYCINKELGWWMISVYVVCCFMDVLLEMDIF